MDADEVQAVAEAADGDLNILGALSSITGLQSPAPPRRAPEASAGDGGGKGALAAWGSHMRLVSTKLRPWGLIYGLGATLGGSGVLRDGF